MTRPLNRPTLAEIWSVVHDEPNAVAKFKVVARSYDWPVATIDRYLDEPADPRDEEDALWGDR